MDGAAAEAALRWWCWASVRLFFGRVELGAGPSGARDALARGGAVVCPNHGNSLVDAALLVGLLAGRGRRVRCAAKDTLWRSWWCRPLLRACGAVPLQRRADHGKNADNAAALRLLAEALAAGDVVVLFPEGLSRFHPQLATPLFSGAVVVAAAAASLEADADFAVPVVPCGIHYGRREHARTGVSVALGEPLMVGSTVDARLATAELEARIRGLAPFADTWEGVANAVAAAKLCSPARAPLTTLATNAARAAGRQLPEVATYEAARSRAGIPDEHVARPPRSALLQLLLGVAGLLAAAPGAALALLPVQLPYVLIERRQASLGVVQNFDEAAQYKVLYTWVLASVAVPALVLWRAWRTSAALAVAALVLEPSLACLASARSALMMRAELEELGPLRRVASQEALDGLHNP